VDFRKSYWQLIYFLKKNTAVVDAMTHEPLNTTHLQTELTSVNHPRGGTYKLKVGVAETSIMRIRMAFSYFLSGEIGIKDKSMFQSSTKKAWLSMKIGECFHTIDLLLICWVLNNFKHNFLIILVLSL